MGIASASAATHFESGQTFARARSPVCHKSLVSIWPCPIELHGKFAVNKGAEDQAIPRRGDMRPLVDGNHDSTVVPTPRAGRAVAGIRGSKSDLEGCRGG